MKVFLVIWSEQDSGYEIKFASTSQEKSQTVCDNLNQARRDYFIASTEQNIKDNHPALESCYGEWARHVGRTAADCARAATLTFVSRADFPDHHIDVVEVEE